MYPIVSCKTTEEHLFTINTTFLIVILICHTNAFLELYVKQGREDYMSIEAGGYASSSVATKGSPNPERTQQRRQTRSVPKQRCKEEPLCVCQPS